MPPIATHRRRLQFESGPEKQLFYACKDCLPDLEAGRYTCFYPLPSEPVEACEPDEDVTCDLCREGGDEDYWDY
jgi:hypothetical protein